MDISNAMNSYLNAKAAVAKWEKNFMAEWMRPIIKVLKENAIEGARNSENVDQNKLMRNLSPEAQEKWRKTDAKS